MEPREIRIRGAREHNLKGIDLTLPKDRLIVFTGVSGSGKSSLAFDTLYAEGQRRYVESLSAYARQFLGQMEKPHVDQITGLAPAISIEQRSAGSNPRSTVGTVTEIYDYLRVLYARAGVQHCPECHRPIGAQSAEQMVRRLLALPEGTRVSLLAPLVERRKGQHEEVLRRVREAGFVRVRVDGRIEDIETLEPLARTRPHTIEAVVDRLLVRPDQASRITDSVETALAFSGGRLIAVPESGEPLGFSERRACPDCGLGLPEPTPQLFSFNSPLGMCPRCSGLGTIMEADPALLVPDSRLSLAEGALPFYGSRARSKGSVRWAYLEQLAEHLAIDLETPFQELPEEGRRILLYGSGKRKFSFGYNSERHTVQFDRPVAGLVSTITRLYLQTASEAARRYYQGFIAQRRCPDCGGARLRREALAVTVGGLDIRALTARSVRSVRAFLTALELPAEQAVIAADLRREIEGRLAFLENVGLHYLTLDRAAPSLSGGEAQRIRLASQIGSGLTGVLYILDEPSIGLHPRDNRRLIESLTALRDLGNTVIVVEHDREIMETADLIVDFGPGAGERGGLVVARGTPDQIRRDPASLTGRYLAGELAIRPPAGRRAPERGWLTVRGARLHNLKEIDAAFPIGLFTCVTGVSGSGKSSLVGETLYPALARRLHRSGAVPGPYREVAGLELADKVIRIDQRPIGRTPRSNPATYVKAFDEIRALFARLPEARARGFRPTRFSFNVKGGRCESCQGAGVRRIEMHFLADVFVTCSECGGRRFNSETLQVRYKGLSIAEVLELEVARARELFASIPRLRRLMQTLIDVGLEYVRLGQPAPTLSGGEAQRIKLARELARRDTGATVYVLDEPTTGLHFADIEKLLAVIHRLAAAGNTVIVIEHNLDMVRSADWVIDLGPEGGEEGGYLVAVGPPEAIAAHPTSHTGRFLRELGEGLHLP